MLDYQLQSGRLVEPERKIQIDGEYDVIVAGGGIAGVGAAIAAARMGCKTLVVERESCLGGLATVGLVNIPLDFLSGIGAEMFKRLEEVNGLWHRNSDPEKHKLVLDRMVGQCGCDVLFHTQIVESIVKQGAICGVVVESKAGRQAILARRVIDCSGDGDAAAFAGCGFSLGRASDNFTQACSLEFRLGAVDWDKYCASSVKQNDPQWYKLLEERIASGDVPAIENHLNWITHVPGRPEHCGKDEVSLCIAHSRNCRPLSNRDLTRMYLEGREQVDTLWKFIRKFIPGFETCYVVDSAPLLGVRDTRRINGEYELTTLDVASRAKFDDVVAISWRNYDVHKPDGMGNLKWAQVELNGKMAYVTCTPRPIVRQDLPPGGEVVDYKGRKPNDPDFCKLPQPEHYDIPYRSLVPVDVENLLVAGRCLSSDFQAQSATRLIMCCNAMGEAAGIATALSLKHDIAPRKVSVLEIQKKIIADGGNLGQKLRPIAGLG